MHRQKPPCGFFKPMQRGRALYKKRPLGSGRRSDGLVPDQ
ncbi:hypothetical protein SUBVAR_06183 [Subdoligranulum variabile DSM 15176]|uniref:Uncharacterized protein n=1 Tax=Subdoligranulum variabile DSM 15176 TaxID=411471 RepID=D1PP70_9FIRM|nr:hypothetical protein SUBVAR_06183 [Subdoligranulum variabile DSM 15176]